MKDSTKKSLYELSEFWFAECDENGWPTGAANKRWFMGGSELDDELTKKFSHLPDELIEIDDLQLPDDSKLAATMVIALDQVPRNIFRGTKQAFAYDHKALELANKLRDTGVSNSFALAERIFVLMPFEHAEDLKMQNIAIDEFTKMATEVPGELEQMAKGWIDYAEQHRDIIEKFGRFPYRNLVLSRQSSPEEEQWMHQKKTNFGQKPK